jgi:small subunit ribosomal protein S6
MATRTYEVMYIIDPDTPEERMEKLNEAVAGLIEKEGGSIIRKEEYGLKAFAYPIQKKTEGYYVLYEINGSGQEIAELERRMRVNDMILRYITVRTDEERKTADKRTLKRETRAAKRASFRQAIPVEETTEAPAEA